MWGSWQVDGGSVRAGLKVPAEKENKSQPLDQWLCCVTWTPTMEVMKEGYGSEGAMDTGFRKNRLILNLCQLVGKNL
jgi:hypothetical protein